MTWTGLGLAANVMGILVLIRGGARNGNVNVRAALLEVVNYALGSVAVLLAAGAPKTSTDVEAPRSARTAGRPLRGRSSHRPRAAPAACGVAPSTPARRYPQVIDGQLLVTEPKTAKCKRFVPISEPAEQLLRRIRANEAEERSRAGSVWRQTGFVFTTEFGESCDPRNALRALKAAAAKAGLSAGLHTLRHSAASVMLTHGVPLKVVSEVLGHSSIAITGDVYGLVAPDVSRGAVATLGAVLDK